MTAAREVTASLGGRWHGSYGTACCPSHPDRSPSLSICSGADGRLLIRCFAGCEFTAIRDALADRGLWPEHSSSMPPAELKQARRVEARHDRAQTHRAIELWREAVPARGTIVERYLLSRNLLQPEVVELRFHPSCPRGTNERLPAMLGLFRDVAGDEPCGLHRTFLKPDGSGKAEGTAKMMLGRSRGAAIKLSPDGEVARGLGIVEGIENAIAVLGKGWAPVWATGSAGGIACFPPLNGIESLTIFADADRAGEAAARQCAQRWREAGKDVAIEVPYSGDWNDALRAPR
jgi:putative DNA primase/helicase